MQVFWDRFFGEIEPLNFGGAIAPLQPGGLSLFLTIEEKERKPRRFSEPSQTEPIQDNTIRIETKKSRTQFRLLLTSST